MTTEPGLVSQWAFDTDARDAVGKNDGTLQGTAAFVTIHPSWLLRMEDEADKEREYKNFVADLRPAAKVLAKKVA